MAPFRDLLKRNRQFYWDCARDELFEWAKAKIMEKVYKGVKRFDMDRATCLSTDFSRTGLGSFFSSRIANVYQVQIRIVGQNTGGWCWQGQSF